MFLSKRLPSKLRSSMYWSRSVKELILDQKLPLKEASKKQEQDFRILDCSTRDPVLLRLPARLATSLQEGEVVRLKGCILE